MGVEKNNEEGKKRTAFVAYPTDSVPVKSLEEQEGRHGSVFSVLRAESLIAPCLRPTWRLLNSRSRERGKRKKTNGFVACSFSVPLYGEKKKEREKMKKKKT